MRAIFVLQSSLSLENFQFYGNILNGHYKARGNRGHAIRDLCVIPGFQLVYCMLILPFGWFYCFSFAEMPHHKHNSNGNLYSAHPCNMLLGAEQLKENLLKSIQLQYPKQKHSRCLRTDGLVSVLRFNTKADSL